MPRESARFADVALRSGGGSTSTPLTAVFWLMFLTVVPILKGLIPKA